VDDRETKPSARFQDAPDLSNGVSHRIDVVKRHEGDRQVGTDVFQWQRGGIGQPDIHRPVGLAGCRDQGRRRIDAEHPMAEFLEMSRKTPFAAADVHRPPTRRRQKLKELIAMVPPETVVSRMPRPLNPLSGVGFPAVR
jgi:hypothetical protein